MENFPTKKTIHFGHLGLILLCAAILVGITFFKNGFKIFTPKVAANQASKILTYEEVKAQVTAQNKPQLDEILKSIDDNTNESDVALLDPTKGGQVLGASTEDVQNLFGDLGNIFNPEALDKIQIESTIQSSKENIKAYADQMRVVENSLGSLEVLSNLNSEDKVLLKDNVDKTKTLIAALYKIQVPEELVDYHKYKLLYYLSISHLSEIMAGIRSETEVDNTTQIFFGSMQKIQDIQQNIFKKYQVSI